MQEWPAGGPGLAWKVGNLGGGDSAPAVAEGKLYGMSIRGDAEVVWCLSEKGGSELWVSDLGPAVPQGMPQSKEGPGGTPTVDGDRVYVIGMGGVVACLQETDGKLVWKRSMTEDFGGVVPAWSYRESPLVDGDKVICTPGSDGAMLVALDKMTGRTVWQTRMPGAADAAPVPAAAGGRRGGFGGRGPSSGAAYSSVIAYDFEGQRQYAQLTAKSLLGVAAETGELLWQYEAPANRMGINCTTPFFHEGRVFAASAYGAGGGVVKLAKGLDGAISAEEVWFSRQIENHHGGVVLVDGALYGANGGNGGGYLICLDYGTGEVIWNERDPDKRRVKKGSLAVADGRIFYRTEEGEILLIEPSKQGYMERGRFEQPERTDKPAWAHPVVANGRLYIRDQDTLFCYDVKAD